MSKRSEETGADAHAKVSDDNVTVRVLGAVENVLGSEEWVKRDREKSVLEVSVDDVMLMEAVDSIENRADDGGRVVLSKLALCEDTVKELSAGSEFEKTPRC